MRQIGVFRGLSGRLIVAFIGVVGIVILVLAVTVPQLARSYQLATLEARLTDEAGLVADYAASELGHSPNINLDNLTKRLGPRSHTRITIIALDGTVLGESHQDLGLVGNHSDRPEIQQAISSGRGIDLRYSETVGYDMLYVAVPIVMNDNTFGTARAALPLSDVDQMVDKLTQAIMIAAITGGLLAIFVAIIAARAINRPLAELTRLAGALADDPIHATYNRKSNGPAEVAVLSRTLDRMAKAIQDSLQRTEAERDRLDAILANLADGVVALDEAGRVVLLNTAARKLLSIEKSAGSGNTAAEVLRDHELIDFVDQVRLSPIPPSMETRFVELRNPRTFLWATICRFGAGKDRQTLLVLQDLTEIQRLETVRRDFVANVSHELRTPIASIKIMTETLQDGAIDDAEAARDFLNRIEQEVDGLHRMVEELLELTRLESRQINFVLAPTDAVQLIEDTVRRLSAMAQRAEIELTFETQPNLPHVIADAERMGQVLVNLIHNAIKFTPAKGSITVRATTEGDRAVISVADTGVGIDPTLLPRIFERFYKADQARATGGTGLGLAISKHTVQLHAGKIWAESAGPGRGMTVFVSLPTTPRV